MSRADTLSKSFLLLPQPSLVSYELLIIKIKKLSERFDKYISPLMIQQKKRHAKSQVCPTLMHIIAILRATAKTKTSLLNILEGGA